MGYEPRNSQTGGYRDRYQCGHHQSKPTHDRQTTKAGKRPNTRDVSPPYKKSVSHGFSSDIAQAVAQRARHMSDSKLKASAIAQFEKEFGGLFLPDQPFKRVFADTPDYQPTRPDEGVYLMSKSSTPGDYIVAYHDPDPNSTTQTAFFAIRLDTRNMPLSGDHSKYKVSYRADVFGKSYTGYLPMEFLQPVRPGQGPNSIRQLCAALTSLRRQHIRQPAPAKVPLRDITRHAGVSRQLHVHRRREEVEKTVQRVPRIAVTTSAVSKKDVQSRLVKRNVRDLTHALLNENRKPAFPGKILFKTERTGFQQQNAVIRYAFVDANGSPVSGSVKKGYLGRDQKTDAELIAADISNRQHPWPPLGEAETQEDLISVRSARPARYGRNYHKCPMLQTLCTVGRSGRFLKPTKATKAQFAVTYNPNADRFTLLVKYKKPSPYSIPIPVSYIKEDPTSVVAFIRNSVNMIIGEPSRQAGGVFVRFGEQRELPKDFTSLSEKIPYTPGHVIARSMSSLNQT